MEDKKRVRKKQLYHDIVKQVEFYFSSANLSKDRFMTQALAENENGIELSLLLTFNKLKSLTTDVNVLKKALKLSTRLELTDNDTRIKSKIPFIPKDNADECTIYVERLPLDANQDFLRQIFLPFGDVDYVSLPKFQNGKIKGFAFVEFACPSGAEKAIEEFIKSESYLPIDMAPGNLRSICTFDKRVKEKLLRSKTRNEFDEEMDTHREFEDVEIPGEGNVAPIDETADDKDKKRKPNTSPTVTLDRQTKKVKSADTNDSDVTEQSEPFVTELSSDNAELNNGNNVDTSHHSSLITPSDDDANRKIKKKRRQKKKPMKKERSTAYSGLLILSKADWKKLRNKYLTVQWEKMRSLKKHLNRCKEFGTENDRMNRMTSTTFKPSSHSLVKIRLVEPVVDVTQFKSLVESLSDKKRVEIDVKERSKEALVRFSDPQSARNFIQSDANKWNCCLISGVEEEKYWTGLGGDDPGEKMQEDPVGRGRGQENVKGNKDKTSLPIVPGIIIKIHTPDPITDVKHFKNDLKSNYKDIVYVDVKEGSSQVFVRFNTAENAIKFSPQPSLGQSTILSGKEELAYWDKINEDRNDKFNKQVRVNKRGKQRIIEKAENLMGKHIIFEDPDG